MRATIVRVIVDHLRPKAEYSWSVSDFDFRTAYLDDVDFAAVKFSGAARFEDATFTSDARFDRAIFTDIAWFQSATFTDIAWFQSATFTDLALFNDTTFTDTARFEDATFTDTASFEGANFTGIARFERVSFGGETISFVGPRKWGPPAPVFDWDHDVSQKPANVKPQDWPPMVVAAS